MKQHTIFHITGLLFVISFIGTSQILTKNSFQTSTSSSSYTAPLSNSITDIVVINNAIWLGTGKGLSKSTDGGQSWKNYYGTSEFGTEDISAIGVHGNEVWVATAHSVEKDGQSLPEGSGLHHSADAGATWTYFPQPIDNYNVDTLYYNDFSVIRALGITTKVNNITYDIAVTDSAVWITSFAGMARKFIPATQKWEVVILPPDKLNSIAPTDTLHFDMSPASGSLGLSENLNHRAFSVLAENDSVIWIGTAGGINRTSDGGRSWKRFTSTNQIQGISGNFVVALGSLSYVGKNILWAATEPTTTDESRAVSFSTDNGETWKQTLSGEFAHNFAANNNFIYVATDNGMFRSNNFGTSWIQSGSIYDAASKQRYTQSTFYSATVYNGNVWCGGVDGIAVTPDSDTQPFGTTWSMLHASQPLENNSTSYAYPNPFSPDDEVVRIHYYHQSFANASVRIFDFGMNLVRTLPVVYLNSRGAEADIIWNGRNDSGTIVANGVYFYQIIIDNNSPLWGKILVLM
jgi:hypothetical protein